MSTRGIIARPTEGDGFIGRYHHFDAYPTGLGKALIGFFHSHPILAGVEILLDEHPAGWSSIIGDWSKEPGFVEMSNPNREELRDRPQCYCHGDRNEDEQVFDNTDSGCEFAYVIDENTNKMTVYETQHSDGGHAMGMFGFATGGNWQVIGKVDLTDLYHNDDKAIELYDLLDKLQEINFSKVYA